MGCFNSKIANENTTRPIPGCTVFLGGSCNPTKWRKQIVIPMLEKVNMDYYNPQVDEWTSDLIVTENYQKDHAKYLFFVIDDETRAIASMIEVAYYIAQGRKVILVIKNVNESTFDEKELKDLNRGRTYLNDIAKKHNIPIFDSIEPAVHHLIGMEVNARN